MLKWLFGSSRRPAADLLIAEGNRAENDGKLREARELYRKAVEADPGYGKAHLNLGIALQGLGEEDSAAAAYEAALGIDADDAYANYNLGRLLASRGDLARAERLLRAALERKREFPDALVALANVCEAQGNADAALAALEEALRLRGFAGAGDNYDDALLRLNRRAAAETAFRRALESDPACLPALHMLGNMLRADSRIDEALEAFGAARRLEANRFDLESMELHVLNLSDEIGEEALAARHRRRRAA